MLTGVAEHIGGQRGGTIRDLFGDEDVEAPEARVAFLDRTDLGKGGFFGIIEPAQARFGLNRSCRRLSLRANRAVGGARSSRSTNLQSFRAKRPLSARRPWSIAISTALAIIAPAATFV